MRRYYPRDEDLLPTDQEKDAAKTAAGAQQTGEGWGKGIGATLGAVGGGLAGAGLSALLAPAGGAGIALSPELIAGGAGLGASLGGGLGSAIGSGIGGAVADGAQKDADALGEKRARLLQQFQIRKRALDALLAEQ